jgi:hypothetical protein
MAESITEAGRALDGEVDRIVFGAECGHVVEKVPLDELIRRERAEFLAEYGQDAPPTWEGSARYDFEEADYPPKWCTRCHIMRPWPTPPNYSGEMFAAMRVIDKMRERGFDFTLRNYGTYTMQFERRDLSGSWSRDGDTAPLAICLAALAALTPVTEGRDPGGEA